jgi:predicted flavoprotein YhiN
LTEYGLEGAPIYYLNPSIRKDFKLPIYIDFKPSHSEDEIITTLIKSKNVSVGLKKLKLPTVFVFWCKQFLSKEEYNELSLISRLIKQFPIYINSFRPIEEAISCAGGVSWGELSEKLQLMKFPNVSVVGEMIDWEAPTGGYLLQGAFSMGFVVGN